MLATKALKGASWLVFSRFIGRIIDFFTLLILTRLLSPSDFGLAALAMSLVMIVDTILEVPVMQALVRLEVVDRQHLDTGFTLGVLRSMLTVIIVLAAAWPFSMFNHNGILVPIAAVLSIGPMVKGIYSPAMVYFTRQMEFRPTFWTEFFGKIFAFTVTMLAVINGFTYWSIVVNFVMAATATTAASYILAPYRPRLSLARIRDFLSFIGWFNLAQLVSALNWQFDRLFVGALSDKATLGRYAVASDVSIIPTQSLIGPALQPVMAAFAQIRSDPERLRLAFLKAVRFAMLISLPVSFGIALTADLLTPIVLGAKWTSAAPLLSILALSVLPVPYFQTLYSASLALDRPYIIFRLNVIDLLYRIIFVVSGFYLASVEGVSLARVAIAVVMFGYYVHDVQRLLLISVWAQLVNLWKPFAASIAMVLVVLALRQLLANYALNDFVELVAVAVTGALVYFGALLLTGVRLVFGTGRIELVDRT